MFSKIAEGYEIGSPKTKLLSVHVIFAVVVVRQSSIMVWQGHQAVVLCETHIKCSCILLFQREDMFCGREWKHSCSHSPRGTPKGCAHPQLRGDIELAGLFSGLRWTPVGSEIRSWFQSGSSFWHLICYAPKIHVADGAAPSKKQGPLFKNQLNQLKTCSYEKK